MYVIDIRQKISDMNKKVWLAILGTFILSEAILTGLLPISRGYLFDLLSTKSGPIWTAIILYFFNYFFLDFCQSLKGYIVLKVSLFYRTIRTKTLYKDFLRSKLVGIKNLNEYLPSNSPQRIQEDIKLSYVSRITVWVEYIISGIILVQLFLQNIHQPLLVAFALGYAVISVYIAIKFNPRLTRAEKMVQQEEASYRTKLSDNILDITGLNVANQACLKSKMIQTEYLLFTKLQLGMVAVLPYVILIPQLLAGTMTLGDVVAHQATFGLIVVNASVLIQLYTVYVQGKASEERVKEIED
jgi:ABC-type uncharacterized transport system fused permease/ATPase subunit